jgi:ATP-dependent helicase HrpB
VVRRLFTRQDYAARPPFTTPEIARLELSGALLDLAAVARQLPGAADPAGLPWLDPPPAAMVESCRGLLALLGALDDAGTLTPLGEELAGAPLHPRLARVMAEGRRLGIAGAAALSAVLVNEGMILRPLAAAPAVTDSDVLWQMELFLAWSARRELPAAVRESFDKARAERVEALYRQLADGGGLPGLAAVRLPT